MRVSVPGNVLLLGEYAVLEEGGLGIAAAVDGRVRLEAEPAASLSITGLWTGGSFRWTRRRREESPLVSAAVDAVREWWHPGGGRAEHPKLRIRIDSSELYRPGGRKAGLGSSAAVAVALVAALRGDNRAKGRPDDAVPLLALAAHRKAQGGAGSGYDVYCSYFGGWGVFRGGSAPSWKCLRLPFAARLYLFSGPAPVSTTDAIRSYVEWKTREPDRARRLLEESNRNVAALAQAHGAREAVDAFRAARRTGIALGEAIGVDARIAAPAGVDPELCKAVGAGNELGVYLRLPDAPEPPAKSGLTEVQVADGISWQP